MPKRNYKPQRNRRITQPGRPPGITRGLYQLRFDRIEPTPRRLIFECVMLNFVTRQEIRVEALGAWTSFNDQGIVIEKDFVPVPFNAYRENIWSLAIDIGTESGNIRVFIPPSAPKMTSNHGLLCMGFIDTLNIPA